MDANFKEILQNVVNLSTEDKISLAVDAVKGLAPELRENFSNEQTLNIIISIFSTAAAADGKLAVPEFALIQAFLSSFELDIPDEKAVEMIADYSKREAYVVIHKLNEILSPEGQTYLFSIVAAVAAIDDRIDTNEVSYLSDLYNV